jgi:salicylate hydroxylase
LFRGSDGLIQQARVCGVTDAGRTSIAIIGGGIGGLAAAAVLGRAGFDVEVYEQARSLGEVGAGINIGPNASRILNRLGIADALTKTGVRPITFDQRRWDDGRILLRAPLGDAVETTFGAPYYTLHRGDLHRAISTTARRLRPTS